MKTRTMPLLISAVLLALTGCVSRGYREGAAAGRPASPEWTKEIAAGPFAVTVPVGAPVGHQWNQGESGAGALAIAAATTIRYQWGNNVGVDAGAFDGAARDAFSVSRWRLAKDDAAPYAVEGTVTELAFDTYGDAKARARVKVAFALRDRSTHEVVSQMTTDGETTIDGMNASGRAIPHAFEIALWKFMGDKDVRARVRATEARPQPIIE